MENLNWWAVKSPKDVYALLELGGKERVLAQTRSNDVSSRSHTVFMIIML